jgi:hypothetical protein
MQRTTRRGEVILNVRPLKLHIAGSDMKNSVQRVNTSFARKYRGSSVCSG